MGTGNFRSKKKTIEIWLLTQQQATKPNSSRTSKLCIRMFATKTHISGFNPHLNHLYDIMIDFLLF